MLRNFVQTSGKKIRSSIQQEVVYFLHDQLIVLKRLAFETNGLKFVELIPDYEENIERIFNPFSQELCYRMQVIG
jgi:hypothetical protein